MAKFNITMAQPEIPNAAPAPKKVGAPAGTPLMQSPLLVTAKTARKRTQENLKQLNELTGSNFMM